MTRTLTFSAILALVPMFAPAFAHAECSWHQQQVSITCAEGLTLDSETGKCVEIVG